MDLISIFQFATFKKLVSCKRYPALHSKTDRDLNKLRLDTTKKSNCSVMDVSI